MNSRRILGVFLVFFICNGCTVVVQPAATERTQEISHDKFNSDSIPERAEAPRVRSIADTIKLCNAIKAHREIPIGCSFDYYKGTPALIIDHPNLEIMKIGLKKTMDIIVDPFCNSANNANRVALVILNSMKEESALVYSCETSKSEWIEYGDEAI